MFHKLICANIVFFSFLHANGCTGSVLDENTSFLQSKMNDGVISALRGKVVDISKKYASLQDGEKGNTNKSEEVAKSKSVYLENYLSGRRLYAQQNRNFDDGFGDVSPDKPKYDDQKWYLDQTSCDDKFWAKCYYIVNAVSGRRIFAQKGKDNEKGVGASSNSKSDDQKWWFDKSTCGKKDCFYIVNAASGRRLYAEKDENFEDGVGATFGGQEVDTIGKKQDDQKWYIG